MEITIFILITIIHVVTGSKTKSHPPVDLLTATIPQLKEALSSHQFTSKQLIQWYLERITKVNRKGPKLHAVIETNPGAMKIAHQLDLHKSFHQSRPLNGIPVLVKDNIATADKMNTTAGSYALLGSRVPRDAFVVEKLRKAGAIILGKASLSEWAGFRASNSTRQGVSARGGISKSAYLTDGDPSGSSSGPAIAVSIGLCAAALGTETDGSIIQPAGRNGIVGLKPTVGLTSRSGVVPISHRQDSIGPMGRTVGDVALLLEVIQGEDWRDDATQNVPMRQSNYTQYLKGTNGFKNMRLGIVRQGIFTNLNSEVVSTFDKAIKLMKSHGAHIQDPMDIDTIDEIMNGTAEVEVLLMDFKQDIQHYLSELIPKRTKVPRTLADLIDFNNHHSNKEFSTYMPDQDYFLMAENSTTTENITDYIRLSKSVEQIMNKYNADALVLPADVFPSPSAISGLPTITVPLGYLNKTEGLQPFGIAFIARAWNEGILLQLAHAFEQ
ncbi:unnamed protein product, partial [Didymodactylos carnosus]